MITQIKCILHGGTELTEFHRGKNNKLREGSFKESGYGYAVLRRGKVNNKVF